MKFSIAFSVLHNNCDWKKLQSLSHQRKSEMSRTVLEHLKIVYIYYPGKVILALCNFFPASCIKWWENMQIRLFRSCMAFDHILQHLRGGEYMRNAVIQFSLRFLVNQQNVYIQSLILSLRLVPVGSKSIQVNKTSLRHTMLRELKATHPISLQLQIFQ